MYMFIFHFSINKEIPSSTPSVPKLLFIGTSCGALKNVNSTSFLNPFLKEPNFDLKITSD